MDNRGYTCPDLLTTPEALEKNLANPRLCLIDIRPSEQFASGHIPGAVHIDWTHNLEKNGSFKSAEDLQAMYQKAGVTSDREIFAYCQGGYRSAHSYLALRLLGYSKVRNYIRSWKEWGDRLDLPIDKPWEKK